MHPRGEDSTHSSWTRPRDELHAIFEKSPTELILGCNTHSPLFEGVDKSLRSDYGLSPWSGFQQVTADHITSLKDSMLGIKADRDALTIKDEYSGL